MTYNENLTSEQVKEEAERFYNSNETFINHPTDSSLYMLYMWNVPSSVRTNLAEDEDILNLRLSYVNKEFYKEFYLTAEIVAGHTTLPDSASTEQKIYWESLKKKCDEALKNERARTILPKLEPVLSYIMNKSSFRIAYDDLAREYFYIGNH